MIRILYAVLAVLALFSMNVLLGSNRFESAVLAFLATILIAVVRILHIIDSWYKESFD